MDDARRLRPDWHPGTIPENVVSDPSAYLGTSYSFIRFRSEEPVGLRIGRAASLGDLTILDVGPRGPVGNAHYALPHGAPHIHARVRQHPRAYQIPPSLSQMVLPSL